MAVARLRSQGTVAADVAGVSWRRAFDMPVDPGERLVIPLVIIPLAAILAAKADLPDA
ncbi:hypothetical protein [Streptomyces sp. AC512_CC834]|uniref:hypothetical protein n=1 Tax=Streptomyces sp. AC512_CC834 TaxID=2823691 RepID=UPI001C26D5CF|nr:hypothetical protein [Streptomyces sp. AC512_CC834]